MSPVDVTVALAFVAGLLSFASPCVLPLVPAFVSHLAGVSLAEALTPQRRLLVLAHAACFVAGFSLVFTGLWVSIGLVGYVVRAYAGYLRVIGGAVLVVLGLHAAGVFTLPWLMMERRPHLQVAPGLGTSFVMGLFFASGWTPCIGTVLAGIIGLATLRGTVWQGAYLLLAYSAGLGVPFLAVALGLGWAAARIRALRAHLRFVMPLSGAFVAAVGLLMLTNTFQRLPQYFSWGAY